MATDSHEQVTFLIILPNIAEVFDVRCTIFADFENPFVVLTPICNLTVAY